MHSKVSSDGLSSYIKAIRPVLEILLKMPGYFPGSPRKVKDELVSAHAIKAHGEVKV
jgi:hypothetical protein